MSTSKITFSPSRLREARRKRKLTIAKLANLVGVSQAAAGHWESGKNIPKPEKIQKLSSILGLSTDYFDESVEGVSIMDSLSEVDREFLSLLSNAWEIPPIEALRRSLKESLSTNMQGQKSKRPPETGDIDQQQGQVDGSQSR